MDKKYIILIIIMIIIWGSLFWYMINYGESVKKHPCNVCADKMGKDVICYNGFDSITFNSNEK